MPTDEFPARFEELHAAGMAAKDAGDHGQALEAFQQAGQLAAEHGDNLRRLHAITPAARALWSMGHYGDAAAALGAASAIAEELGLKDEHGITVSNIGRLAAVKTVKVKPVEQQRAILLAESVPRFREAYSILRGHEHLYYRYANAQHGSVVAAMGGDRRFAGRLVAAGLLAAFRKSDEPYDQKRTYQINRRGLAQLAVAAALIPFGDRTPILANFARTRLIR